MPTHSFMEDDSVVVRPEVTHPSFDYDLTGWQGRVTDVLTELPSGDLIEVEWDSLTLEAMPVDYIQDCDKAGIDWTRTELVPGALLPAEARDSVSDVTRTASKLSERYESAGYQESREGRISAIIAGAEDRAAALQVWASFLGKNLNFPFDAEVAEFQEQGPLQEGDVVQVQRISLVDDEYGVLMSVEHEGRRFDFPLSELEALDVAAPNSRLLDDYAAWFAEDLAL